MKSTHTATLKIPQLSKSAKEAHIVPAMEKNSLLSVVQLCDEGYFVLFSRDEVKILDEKQKIIMKGNLINYSHSRNPPCAPARTQGQIQAPREPPN
jgi:hypothetical protein